LPGLIRLRLNGRLSYGSFLGVWLGDCPRPWFRNCLRLRGMSLEHSGHDVSRHDRGRAAYLMAELGEFGQQLLARDAEMFGQLMDARA